MQIKTSGSLKSYLGKYVPNSHESERAKREAWIRHGILVVDASDPRLDWLRKEVVAQIGKLLYEGKK